MFRTKVLPFLAWALLSIWSRTIRMTVIMPEASKLASSSGKGCIYAFWHGRQFLLFHCHRDSGIVIPASESRDGEIQANILHHFGYEVVRGSSKRKGDRALLGLVDALRNGKIIAVGVDGPRGPVYQAKPGVLYLAGKLGIPIVPGTTSAKRRRILEKIWDKLLIPLPFTQGVLLYGEPIIVKGISEAETEAKRNELELALNSLTVQADNYFKPQR